MSATKWTPAPVPTDYRFINLVGEKYGRLLVKAYAGRDKLMQHLWHCLCDCGAACVARGGHLRSGAILSCGCHRVDVCVLAHLVHGKAKRAAKAPEYRSWMNMRERCRRPTNNRFHLYGGRGIVVCERWLTGDGSQSGFECFLADMGVRPSRAHSIDRIDNDGNYEPSNCRWATASEQMRNRRPFKLTKIRRRKI